MSKIPVEQYKDVWIAYGGNVVPWDKKIRIMSAANTPEEAVEKIRLALNIKNGTPN